MNIDRRVAIVCGGNFPESEVSRRNAEVIKQSLSTIGYSHLKLVEYHATNWANEISKDLCDVVICALDGPHGEGGLLQGFLSVSNIPFTGSATSSSAICQRKSSFKAFCRGYGYNTPNWTVIENNTYVHQDVKNLKLPLFVKPNNQGSSFGLSFVRSAEEIAGAIDIALQYDHEVLIEEAIHGDEITIGILKLGGAIISLPALKVSAKEGYLSRESKAENRITTNLAQEIMEPGTLQMIEKISIDLYRKLACDGICRIDGIFENDVYSIIECNTFPGVIPNHSFVAEMISLAGLELGQIYHDMICSTLDMEQSK